MKFGDSLKCFLGRLEEKYSDKAVLTISLNYAAADHIIPLIKEIKYLCDVGASRTIKIEDWDGKDTFGIDGDGPDSIYDIKLEGVMGDKK